MTPALAVSARSRASGRCRRPTCPRSPARSRSSWTATAAGRRSAACRSPPATAPARERVRRIVEAAIDLGIHDLAVFAFSTENWSRPQDEVDALMEIFAETIERELPDLAEQGVRVRFIGRRDRAPEELRARMEAMEDETELNTRLNLWVAFDYGGRAELVEAARRLVESGVEARGDRRERLRREPLRARAARPRSADPHERRAAHLELPALAARLRGARLRRQALAGLRRARPARRARRVRQPPAPIRRPMSAPNSLSRVVVALVGLPIVLGVVYLGGWWLFALAALAGGARAARVLAACPRPLAPLARRPTSGALLALVGARDRRPRVDGRRAPDDVRARVPAEGDLRRRGSGDDRDQRDGDGRALDRRRPRVPAPPAAIPRTAARGLHGAARGLGRRHVAYFAGRLLGRHKLAPATSPGKTWEGFVFGTAATVFVTFVALYKQHFLTIPAVDRARRGDRRRGAARRPVRVAAQAGHGGEGQRQAARRPRRHARPHRRVALRGRLRPTTCCVRSTRCEPLHVADLRHVEAEDLDVVEPPRRCTSPRARRSAAHSGCRPAPRESRRGSPARPPARAPPAVMQRAPDAGSPMRRVDVDGVELAAEAIVSAGADRDEAGDLSRRTSATKVGGSAPVQLGALGHREGI